MKKDQIVGRLIKENDAHNPSHCRTFLFWSIWIGYKHIMCGEHNWLLLCNNCLRAWLFAWDWTFQHIFCALFLSLCTWSSPSVICCQCVKAYQKTCRRLPCRRTPMHYGGAHLLSEHLSLLSVWNCLLFIWVLLS